MTDYRLLTRRAWFARSGVGCGSVALAASLADRAVTRAGEMATPRVVNVRPAVERKTRATLAVVFLGRAGLPGHGFVSWCEESERLRMSVVRSWGFYPARGGKGVIGPVPGEIADEATRGGLARGEPALIVRVNAEQYRKADDVRRRWSSKQAYRLTVSDCLTFCQDVARTLPGLKIPPREPATVLPSEYIRRLAAANGK